MRTDEILEALLAVPEPPTRPSTKGPSKHRIEPGPAIGPGRVAVCGVLAVVAVLGLVATGLAQSSLSTSQEAAITGHHDLAVAGPTAPPGVRSTQQEVANVTSLGVPPSPTPSANPLPSPSATPAGDAASTRIVSTRALARRSTTSGSASQARPITRTIARPAAESAARPVAEPVAQPRTETVAVTETTTASTATTAQQPKHTSEWYAENYQHTFAIVQGHSAAWRSASPWTKYFSPNSHHTQAFFSRLYWDGCSQLRTEDAAQRNLNPYRTTCVD